MIKQLSFLLRFWFQFQLALLHIGTLYCAKGNFEFGISRIIKSLEPYNKKLETDTWFYAKRCGSDGPRLATSFPALVYKPSFRE
jgi:hypothetical protein